MTMHKLIFFGNERLGTGLATTAPTLQALIDNRYQITGVVVAQKEVGKSRTSKQQEVVQLAETHNIPVFAPEKLADIADDLAAMKAEAAVLIAYGKIVPQSVIDIFPKGIINIHPSLLPRHRGSTPIESVILDGDAQTGVSLMQLAAEMDAGPVYSQTIIKLEGDETKQDLANKLQRLGADMLIRDLPKVLDGSLEATEQDESLATYDGRIAKADGVLDFTKPADVLDRQIRAYAVWPRSRTTIEGTEVIITKAHAGDGEARSGAVVRNNDRLGIGCSQGILILDALTPNGKKEITASAFINGYLSKPGS